MPGILHAFDSVCVVEGIIYVIPEQFINRIARPETDPNGRVGGKRSFMFSFLTQYDLNVNDT
jgi:hypothetical protein